MHEFSSALKKGGDDAIVFGEDHPDRLDEAYISGMEKRDLKVSRVGDGYAGDGFLDIPTGAKLQTVLSSLGSAVDRDDDRTPAQRRLDGLGALLDAVLDHGLPTRKGIRPHLQVAVDLDRLQGMRGAEPARLATPAQRTAVHLRQGGRCASPGGTGTVLELHHLDWWPQ